MKQRMVTKTGDEYTDLEPETFRQWLYRTVRSACLMGRRKKVGEPALPAR
jgi:hypothetical protein